VTGSGGSDFEWNWSEYFPEKKRECYARDRNFFFPSKKGETCRRNTRQLETNFVSIQLLLFFAFLKEFGGRNDHHADLFRHDYLQRPPGRTQIARKERK
jgi:hypothetical protein